MRYLSLLLFAVFLVFSVDFATQNTLQVFINYKIELLNFDFRTERPIFVPVFFSFAFGIIFSVFYFFFSHASLLRKLRLKRKEIKKLESLIEKEKVNKNSLVDQNKEIQQNIQNPLDYDDNHESFVIEDVNSENTKK